MAYHLDHEECEYHPNVYACPDVVIVRTSYGYALPIHDGGYSGIEIHHCPWCGARLAATSRPTEGLSQESKDLIKECFDIDMDEP